MQLLQPGPDEPASLHDDAERRGLRRRRLGRRAVGLPIGCITAAGDPVDFNDDRPDDDAADADGASPWVVLIVDDDRNVHDATLLALHGERIAGRPLEFRHAYSASEARGVLATDGASIGILLLDVVMESPDAGLQLIADIRGPLGLHDLRIIVRTGQPGRAPEAKVRNDLAIDGYITKATLTRAMLIEALAQVLQPDESSGDAAPH